MKYRIKVWTPVEQNNEDEEVFNDISSALSAQIELEAQQPQNIYEIVPLLDPGESSYLSINRKDTANVTM